MTPTPETLAIMTLRKLDAILAEKRDVALTQLQALTALQAEIDVIRRERDGRLKKAVEA